MNERTNELTNEPNERIICDDVATADPLRTNAVRGSNRSVSGFRGIHFGGRNTFRNTFLRPPKDRIDARLLIRLGSTIPRDMAVSLALVALGGRTSSSAAAAASLTRLGAVAGKVAGLAAVVAAAAATAAAATTTVSAATPASRLGAVARQMARLAAVVARTVATAAAATTSAALGALPRHVTFFVAVVASHRPSAATAALARLLTLARNMARFAAVVARTISHLVA